MFICFFLPPHTYLITSVVFSKWFPTHFTNSFHLSNGTVHLRVFKVFLLVTCVRIHNRMGCRLQLQFAFRRNKLRFLIMPHYFKPSSLQN
jgi:hypothetical protein